MPTLGKSWVYFVFAVSTGREDSLCSGSGAQGVDAAVSASSGSSTCVYL